MNKLIAYIASDASLLFFRFNFLRQRYAKGAFLEKNPYAFPLTDFKNSI